MSLSGDDLLEGEAVQIVKVNDQDPEHSYILDEDALSKILNKDSIRDKPIAIISVAGAFRKGKSFLLNFLLRYLEAGGAEDWLGDDQRTLKGFKWRGGIERETTGILMWSKVYTLQTPTGREVAVALVDTQGSFDENSTVRDCATIFALSLMTSSVMVYNLFNNIQEDNLQHLSYFTEYGRLALEDSGQAPFQKLQFLVRDWQFPYDADYGAEGGQKILDRALKIKDTQHAELQALRTNLRSCFCEMACFLLPHPGKVVTTRQEFQGALRDIDEDFIKHLKTFVPLLLSPRNLIVKTQGGKEVKSKEIIQFFKSYMEIFKGDTMPEPKSMLEVTIEVNNLVSLASAKELYMASMESVCGGDRPYLNEQVLEMEHSRILESALKEFNLRKKMGGEEFAGKYRDQLLHELQDSYQQFKAYNDSKNIFKAANTPITIFVMWSILYIFSQVSSLCMLYPLANFANLLMWGLVVLGATWAYVKYSGEFTEVGIQIEEYTGWVWDALFQPLLNKAVEKGSDIAVRQATKRMSSVIGPSPSVSELKKHR